MDVFTEVCEQASFILIGFLLVVSVLGTLALITSIVGIYFKSAEAKAKAATQAPKAPVAAPVATPVLAAASQGVDPALIAVISAAVYTALNGSAFRLVSIDAINEERSWARSGREAIFTSKNPRR